MKVLFCALKNEYGDPKRGLSMEYKSFFGTLINIARLEVEYFPVDELLTRIGRDAMNEMLIRKVEEWRPDLLFCFLFTDEIKKATINFITKKTKTKTFNWFGDDHWRFPVYSRHWAPLFTVVATTDARAFSKYKSAGILNVIKSQWAANTFTFKPQDYDWLSAETRKIVDQYQITFFGQKYGNRGKYIDTLIQAGLPAKGFGRGWPAGGGVDPQEMFNIFSFSKICLNFTETPYYGFRKKVNLFAKLFVKKELGRYRFNVQNFFDNYSSAIGTQRRTIKSRTFEVPACGGFLLTGDSDDDLGQYYELDKEIVVFKNEADLVAKCKYYLEHEDARKGIAQAGLSRTIKEHTYVHRFNEIFNHLEL